MNTMRTISIFVLTATLTAAGAFAQPSNRVPGPTDYADFSRFITERNIFDPNRQPHISGQPRPYIPPKHTVSAAAPAFSLVGTMTYEKGVFAFFNGNNEDLRKVLYVPGKIAGYTVAKIGHGQVTLETTNQAQKIELKMGDVMREENGVWQMTGPGDVTPATGNGSSHSDRHNSDGTAAGSNAGTGAPPSAAEASEILKRLMEKRAQETK